MIETERLIIRPFKNSDYKRIQQICNDYEVAKTTLSLPIPYTEDNAKSFIDYTLKSLEDNISYELGICLKNNPENIIGCIGVFNLNKISKKAEIGYWIDRNHWKQGIATEATKAIIDFAFNKLNLHSIIARFFEVNPASGKVMEKSGMKYVGKMHDHEFRLGNFHNVIYYEILNPNN